MGIGLLVAFVVPALAVLLVIGPHWRQRIQHLQLMRWERERRLWRASERERYLATLSPPQRDTLRHAIDARCKLSPRRVDGDCSPEGKARASS